MIKQIFTWWNSQTTGTFLYTIFFGKFVGKDQFGNKYYKNKKDTKRWVIYNSIIESTLVNPEWNNWLRYTSLSKPSESEKHDWQINHAPNLTGTDAAYDPENSKKEIKSVAKNDDYKKWSPKD